MPRRTRSPRSPPPCRRPRSRCSTARARERTTVALDELTDAVASAPSRQGRATLTLRAGDGDPDDDTYRLTGDASALEVTAASESGAVRAVYDLASAVRTGHPVTEHLGDEVTSRLPFRMVDLGAVGVTPDPAEWAQRHRLLARVEGVRRRDPADGPLRRPGGARRRPTPTTTPSCGTASPTATPPSRSRASSSSSPCRALPTARSTPRVTSTSRGRWRCARPSRRSGTAPRSSG